MRAAVYHGPGDIRIDQFPDPRIEEPTDAARAYMEELMADVLDGKLDPSPVFDMTVGLDGIPDGYAAMDARKALKVMIRI